ncbi:hypothetical protein QYF36_006236 [Acer negundo]|nr:hypothetical protein QYF36_006236 [Acer negundo]
MPNMDTRNSDVSRAEQLKNLANEAFKEVEPQYSGARIEGDVITLDFVKKMMDDFKNQKCIHKRRRKCIHMMTTA